MRKQVLFILFFDFLFLFAVAQAEDAWKVYHNNRLIFKTTQANEAKNKLKLQQADLKKTGYVLISYQEAHPKKGWRRSISVNNEADSLLTIKDDAVMMRLMHSEIKKLLKNNQALKVYTWSVPTDPNLATSVRVRRIHLCSIELR